MLKYAAMFFIALVIPCSAQVTISGSVSLSGSVSTDAPAAITFSPAAGSYTGTQAVTVGCPVGKSCFYTTDGSTPNIASQEVTGPITISATSTLQVIAAQVGQVLQNTGTASTDWKCVTVNGGTSNGVTCQTGGGVGTIQPSAWTWTWGTPMAESISTTSSTGETQMLNIYTGASCDNCTMLAEDKIVQPTQGSTYIANNEMDVSMYDSTDARMHMGGLQCNQQAGTLQWQIDNQQGSWQDTGITFGCPLSTTQQTHVGYTMHWVPGDTGCGGYGCDYYDTLTITVGGVSNTYSLGKTLEAYTEPGWASYVGNQDQIDLTNTTTSGANPTTAGRSVWNNNVTAGYYGTTVTGSAIYTISNSASAFSATPSSVSEGSIPTATTAYYQPVTVTNTGTANLTFSNIAFTGTNASDFSQTAGFAPAVNPVGGNTYPQCSTSSPVAPGGKCIVPIDFVAGSGSRSGSLTFTDNAAGSPHTVTLSGTGVAASGAVLPACGSMLSANTTYYATGNITCNDVGYGFNGSGITFNLNGYSLTCGQSPSNGKAARWCLYSANSSDPSFNTSFNTDGTDTLGSTTIAVSDATGVAVGQTVTDNSSSLPAGDKVTAISGTNITLSAAATVSATPTFYFAPGCTLSGASHTCALGITPTSNSGGNETIENGTIIIAGGATSSSTMQYSSAAVYTGYGSGDVSGGWHLHDLHITIPLFCASCWAYSGWSDATYNGPGDTFYKNTIIDNSGFVGNRCNYDGTAVRFADTNSTPPGAIAYENSIDHSPQDGIVLSTAYSTAFGNTIKVGNPNGTDAGVSATCSGMGSSPTGTQSANDFAGELPNNNVALVNNTITNYEGRGADMSSPSGALTNLTTAGNTITTTDLPNYVEYQGGGSPGCQLGGSYGIRLNTFGTPSTMSSTGDTTVVTVTNCPGSGYAISSSNNTANFTMNGNYTCKLGTNPITGIACFAISNGDWDYNGNTTPAMFYSSNETYTGASADAGIGYSPTGMSGPWTITNSTFVKPATTAPGSCGAVGTPVEPSWTVFSGCTANLGVAQSMGPIYVRNPIWQGGAGESNLDDFPTATADMTAGSTGSIYIQWGYTVTVNKASGGVASGATVSIVDTKSSAECTATTNSSGVATCWLNETEHSFTAPNPEVITTFNPMAETVTDAGCTTLNDSFSISSTTSRNVTLAGC